MNTTSSTSLLARPGLVIAGGLGLAGVGLAAGLLLRTPAPAADADVATVASTRTPAQGSKSPAGQRGAEATPLNTERTSTCGNCGTVEGVRAVERKGEGSGTGAVIGGVAGAVVGHQMGGGSGKTAMTVLGAIGGGMAGNEIEKRKNTTTVYDVRVRMNDGSLRSFTSNSAPTPGAVVTVSDQGFQVVRPPADGGARVVRTGG